MNLLEAAASAMQPQTSNETLDISDQDQTLFDHSDSDRVSINDWSETGRGSHVDFTDDESVPLVQGKSTTFFDSGS